MPNSKLKAVRTHFYLYSREKCRKRIEKERFSFVAKEGKRNNSSIKHPKLKSKQFISKLKLPKIKQNSEEQTKNNRYRETYLLIS